MPITKQQVIENLEEVKKYINEIKIEQKQSIQIKNYYTREVIYESKKDTIKEVVEEAAQKEISLSEADLREIDLSGIDLSGANLCGANLLGSNLSESILFGSDLCRSDLCATDLREIDLSGIDLSGANLREADLFGSNLSESNLFGSDLSGADMGSASFYGKTDNPLILEENQIDDFLAALGFRRIKKEDFTNNKN